MTEPLPLNTARSVGPAAAVTPGKANAGTGNVAFRALLERLDKEARELAHDAQRIDDPKELAGAVDKAHASLQDALSLGEQLLEAYRQALAQPRPPGNAS